ncbi:hypothetical protein GCM10010198_51420 [Nocardia seriolae]|nr:hypothetical protein NS14008_20240 [Nocardia seriolae]BEK88776.1 hypothetical protein NSERKGN1266_47270 [Nocardia seriolae]BEK96527.1 hypothetical protein NSER024013_44330 [Nocardia seriolae]
MKFPLPGRRQPLVGYAANNHVSEKLSYPPHRHDEPFDRISYLIVEEYVRFAGVVHTEHTLTLPPPGVAEPRAVPPDNADAAGRDLGYGGRRA